MSFIRDIKTFVGGGMNLDDDPRILRPNEHREIWNSILNIAEGSKLGCLQNIKGTQNIFTLPINAAFDMIPSVGYQIQEYVAPGNYTHGEYRRYGTSVYKCIISHSTNSTVPMPSAWAVEHTTSFGLTAIGVCEDVKDNALIFFLCDPDGCEHSILKVHLKNNLCEWVLKSQPVLNFKVDYKISSAFRVGDLMYWTDGYEKTAFVDYNPPRKINTIRAIAFSNVWSATKTYYEGQVVCWTTVNNTTTGCYKYINPVASHGHLVTDTAYWELVDPYCYTSITFQLLDRIKYPPTSLGVIYSTDDSLKYNNLNGKLFQFRYRYVYDDNEKSVWSPISDTPLPSANELLNGEFVYDVTINNRIALTLDLGTSQVIRIEIAFREGNSGIWKKCDTIDKYDLNGTALTVSTTYYFYNDRSPEPLDQDDTERLYDFIPQISHKEELFEKNRIVDGDYVEGFDNVIPDIDLSYTQSAVELTGLNQLLVVTFPQNTNTIYCDLPASIPADTYLITEIYTYNYYSGGNPNPLTSWPEEVGSRFVIYVKVNSGESTQSVITRIESEIHNQTGITHYATAGYPNRLGLYFLTVVPGNPTYSIYCNWLSIQLTSTSPKVKTMKSGASVQLGLAYYDAALRSGGVISNSSLMLRVPYLTENHASAGIDMNTGTKTIHKTEISATINHTPPVWAKYYSWCITKPSISYFLDFHVVSSNIFVSNNNVWIKLNYGIKQMNDALSNSNIRSYQWKKGDRVRFLSYQPTIGSNEHIYFQKLIDYEILNVDYNSGDDSYEKDTATSPEFVYDSNGNKVRDVGEQFIVLPLFTKSSFNIPDDTRIVVCEIYRPELASEETVFYEIGQMIPILNPGTTSRSHSSPSGIIPFGNAYVKARITGDQIYMVEASQYSDFYESETYGYGRPNILIKDFRRTRYYSRLIYSGRYIENTNSNELSRVLASNTIELPEKFGPINFIKEIGFTLKVIQKYKPSSIYIGRQGLTQADVNRGEVLFASDNTLGTVTVSESSYGTEHPLSCVKHERNLYYYDINSGCIVRDSGNGIRSISQPEEGDSDTGYKIKSYLQAKSRTFQENGVEVYAAYDGRYDIVYFAFVDKTDSAESFTIGFHEPSNRWISFYSFIPDFIAGMKMSVISWKDNAAWLHNEGTRMNFYGTQYSQTITTISNKEPLKKKRYRSIKEQSNKVFDLRDQGDVWIDPDDTYTRGQTGLIKAGVFRKIEGGLYAAFGRNMTTHQIAPANDDYINGDEFRGDYVELTLHNDSTDETNLFTIEVDAIESNV